MARRVSATVAKNQLGYILRLAEDEPVYIVKHGRPQAVVIAAETYETLVRRGQGGGDRRPSFALISRQCMRPCRRHGHRGG